MSKIIFFSILLFTFNCNAQNSLNQYKDTSLYGGWKCVKLDTRGYQKFTLQQAKQLEASILTIKKNTFYYKKLDFVESCKFSYWGITNYDTVNLYGNTLEMIYRKKELAKLKVLQPTDSVGQFGCFNDCAIFFLKIDTLINVCGGYTLFFTKVERYIPQDGDTVRCYEGNKCAYTGYVIQGTRAKGHVVHVNPVNKNVPMEVVDTTIYKKEE